MSSIVARMDFALHDDRWITIDSCYRTDVRDPEVSTACPKLLYDFEATRMEAIYEAYHRILNAALLPPVDYMDLLMSRNKKDGLRNHLLRCMPKRYLRKNGEAHPEEYTEADLRKDVSEGCTTRQCIWATAWKNHP
jgi:hypothetical protein